MSHDETAALRAITAYARKHLSTGKVLDLRFDKARGAWAASAIGKAGAIEILAKPQGKTFELSHAQHNQRHDAGAAVRSHAHVRNESAAAFLMRGVVFAAIAAGLGLGYVAGKPYIERLLTQAKEASNPKASSPSELGKSLGGNSAMLETAEKLSKDPKASAAMNRFIKQNAGGAASQLDTLQQLNSTGQ